MIEHNTFIVSCILFLLIGILIGIFIIFKILPNREPNSLYFKINYYPNGTIINGEKFYIRAEVELEVDNKHIIWQKTLINKEDNFIKSFCELDLWIKKQQEDADKYILNILSRED